MPSSYVIGEHFEAFIKGQIQEGRYASASEVIRDGLRLLQDQEDLRRGKLEWLRAELQKGLDSGPASPLDMADIKAEGRRLLAQRRAAVSRQQT